MVAPAFQRHIKIAAAAGWRVRHIAGRCQLINPDGVPLPNLFKSPMGAWAAAPHYTEDFSALFDIARNTFTDREVRYMIQPDGRYRIKIGQYTVLSDEINSPSDVLSRLILAIIEGESEDDDTDTGD